MEEIATLKERVDKHDREIAAIRKLIQKGMRLMVKFDQNMLRLEASQRETDRQLQIFIRSLSGGGGNGRVKHRLQ